MWSLMFFLYLNGAIGITHLDNFNSKVLCEHAAHSALIHMHELKGVKDIDVNYTCVLEID